MGDTRCKGLFARYRANPIIQVRDRPYQADAVFNSAATQWGDETLLFMPVEDRRGVSHLSVARSRNGVTN